VLMRGHGMVITTVRIEMVVLRSISAQNARVQQRLVGACENLLPAPELAGSVQHLGSGPNFGNPKISQAASATMTRIGRGSAHIIVLAPSW